MTYWMGLLGISLVFVVAERLWPLSAVASSRTVPAADTESRRS